MGEVEEEIRLPRQRIRELLDGVIEVDIVGTVIRADPGPCVRVRGDRS